MATHTWNWIELCAGVGMLGEGIRLGCEYLGIDFRPVCYVERDAYAAAALVARMADTSLAAAPIWDDLATFDGRAWRGRVDCLSAGFPCQPWSAAGKQQGTADERWLWPAIANIIRDVGPGIVFLENVPGLVSGGGLEHVLGSLAEMGFDAEWLCLTAAAVGAAHRRERVFILAHHPFARSRGLSKPARRHDAADIDGIGKPLADAIRSVGESRTGRQRVFDDGAQLALATERGQRELRQPSGSAGLPDGDCLALADASGQRRQQDARSSSSHEETHGRTGWDGSERQTADAQLSATERSGQSIFAPGPAADWRSIPRHLWPAIEPGLRVLVDGRSVVLGQSRADQLRCIGNGVVPLCAAVAFVELMRRADERLTSQDGKG